MKVHFKSLSSKEAVQKFDDMGLKVQTVYVTNTEQYGKHAIFINRIANCSNPKFRIIDTQREHVKNCMKITYHPDKWEKRDVERLIQSRVKLLARRSHGSCHSFIRQSVVKETLTTITKYEN